MYSDKSVAELMANADHDPDAQFLIGMHYSEGTGGVEKDIYEAVRWFLRAAEKGQKKAQYILHLHYGLGVVVPIDIKKSLEWCCRAAEQGHIGAKRFLYLCRIVPKGYKQFVQYINDATWITIVDDILHDNYPQLHDRVMRKDCNLQELLEMPEIEDVRKKLGEYIEWINDTLILPIN